jgi:gas vesicle protein
MLKQEILKDGKLKYPIIADEKTHVILDGMHRWLTLKNLGYTLIPVILVNASHNPEVRVGTRRIHRYINDPNQEISIQKVISAGLNGQLMKPRSTRHFFQFSKFQHINYPLRLLKKRSPQNISKYIAETTKQECKHEIKEWQEEITEELEFLTKRKQEAKKEMKDLQKRTNHTERRR